MEHLTNQKTGTCALMYGSDRVLVPTESCSICKIESLETALKKALDENAQRDVQLAGCGVAACGGIHDSTLAKEEAYGWSPSYQDVVELRQKYEALLEREEELEKGIEQAIGELGSVPQTANGLTTLDILRDALDSGAKVPVEVTIMVTRTQRRDIMRGVAPSVSAVKIAGLVPRSPVESFKK
jgi:hypothetical protein